MDHDTYIRTHTPERYILGELPPGERDAFEDHFADCSVCTQELAAAEMFRVNAVAVFEDEARGPAPAKASGWFDFLRLRPIPVFAFSGLLNVALLVLVGYGATRVRMPLASTANGTGAVPMAALYPSFTARPASRSAEPQVITVSKSEPMVPIQFDVPHPYNEYRLEIGGRKQAVAKGDSSSDSKTLILSTVSLPTGDSALVFSGIDESGSHDLFRCVLRVLPAQ